MNDPPALALVREFLKPPLWLVTATPGYTPPPSKACKFCGQVHTSPTTWGMGDFAGTGPFMTLEEAMRGFRRKRSEGRWVVWLMGADGEMVGIDSQKWDLAKDKVG